jgi:hypothetical protein
VSIGIIKGKQKNVLEARTVSVSNHTKSSKKVSASPIKLTPYNFLAI